MVRMGDPNGAWAKEEVPPELLLRWAADLAEAERSGQWMVRGSPARGQIGHPRALAAREDLASTITEWRLIDPRAYLAELRACFRSCYNNEVAARIAVREHVLKKMLDTGVEGIA